MTGASAGIGAEFARQLAERGYGVTLTARRKDRLEELARELSESNGIEADTVACDLSNAAARRRMIQTVEKRGRSVEILINNAGFGTAGRFQELDPENEIRMLRTNVEAVVDLCGHYVPEMVERRRGGILNVASTAAFQPIPRQTTYAATKAFVLSFSEGLHKDLGGTGVTVTALCPGPTKTEFAEVAGIDEGLLELPGIVYSAEQMARAGLGALDRGRRTSVPGPTNLAGAVAGRVSPRAVVLEVLDRFYPVGK
ncbi:MAG: SDR family oxidoreductase [Actinobacteria bacterium]|nr:SDR family oxidoreductase [Actinomycetota bacterium]